MIKSNRWNEKIVNFSFWSINAGLMLMVVLDLFPAGSIQFKAVVEQGLWFGRSSEFVDYGVFKSLTWLRGIGASVFFFGGVIPITYFIVTRINSLKSKANDINEMDVQLLKGIEEKVEVEEPALI